MFEGIDHKNGMFNNTLRSLIVDNILNNLTFKANNDKIRVKFNEEIQTIVYKNLKINNFLNTDFSENFLPIQNLNSDNKILYRGCLS